MNVEPQSLENLISEFASLPGIGLKTARRLAYHMLSRKKGDVERFADSLMQAAEKVHPCPRCHAWTDEELCPICSDPRRDQSVIMVVEDSRDMAAYERTRQYKGLYHILHGVISPLEGIGAGELKIRELLERLKDPQVKEVIIATNPTVEGEATAMYLSRLIKPLEIPVTRIANGVPVGGDLEYIDEVTLTRALEGRTSL